jgi:hypothetical protein
MTTRREREKKRERVSARERVETHRTGFENTMLDVDGVEFFKLEKEGIRRIDVIPYVTGKGNPFKEEGKLHFERTFFAHRGIGPNQNWYVCPAKTAEKRCPICEYRGKLASDPDSDEDEIKALAPRERQLWNVIDLDDRDSGVQLWEISFHLFGKVLDAEVKNADDDEPFEYFADLEDGMTLKLGVKEESFGGNKFYQVETLGFKPRKKNYDEDILKQTQNLDDILEILDYDKLKAIFLQTDPTDGSEEKEEEKPKPPPKKKRSRVKKEEKETPEESPAEAAGIEEGSRVVYEDDEYEVVRISKDGSTLALEDNDGEVVKAIEVDEVKLIEKSDDPDSEVDDEPEEKAPPKKKRTAKPKAEPKEPVDDDDDDDDDWDNFDD